MVRLFSALLIAFFVAGPIAQAHQSSYYKLLPESVQAVVWVRNAEDLGNRWNRTLLHELANDQEMSKFFSEQHDSIQKKLMDAGWRLGVKPQDLAQYLKNEIAVAWLEKPEARKPYALVLIADIENDKATTDRMLSQIDTELGKNKIVKKQLNHLNQQITQYILPKRPGQLLEETSYLAAFSGKLLVTDDLNLMHDLIAKVSGQTVTGKTLAEDADFIASRTQLKVSDSANIEYFVRPLGIAKVIRDIGGKKTRNGVDMLVALKNQGFSAVKCVAGEVWFAEGDADISHRGFVLADFPLPGAAGILDFPNEALIAEPNFVSSAAASYLALKWNAQESFFKVGPLVDELAGAENTFQAVIDGIRKDINGPQVDIKADVLPLLTNDVVAVTDNEKGDVQLNSRRNLIAIRVKDSAKAIKLVDRVMKKENQAKLEKYGDIDIWEFSNEAMEGSDEFKEFIDSDEEQPQEEAWLNQWAICVNEDWLLFSSHAQMLREAIDQSKSTQNRLGAEIDYSRVKQAILQLSGEDPCAWKITRNQLAFKVQYELFRQGKLQDSESMMATILEKITDKNELHKAPSINGHNLPEYDAVAKFLRPSGFKAVATPKGWAFGGLLVGKETSVSGTYKVDTARFGVSATEAR
ncbi:MAG: DUF3352 domain-containing protein [Pirellulales bacterium]